MHTSLEKIISKIRKLQALSVSSNANEAASAAALANDLIDKYRISELDLETEIEAPIVMEADEGFVYETGRIITWKSNLVNVLKDHYGLALINDNYYPEGRKVSRYRLIGRKSDIAICRYMFAWLTAECQRLSDKEAKGKGRIFVQSYCLGFVQGIKSQLNVSRTAVKADASSSALVKMDSLSSQAEDLMRKMYPRTRLEKPGAIHIDHYALEAGKDKGKSLHLGPIMDTVGKNLLK